jgi:hypothetical protein
MAASEEDEASRCCSCQREPILKEVRCGKSKKRIRVHPGQVGEQEENDAKSNLFVGREAHLPLCC